MTETLTPLAARRMALAAQGFGARPLAPTRANLLKTIDRLGLVQIDSVNVLTRTHYLPAFSRLGDYPRALLEEVAWGRRKGLFEYWGHEAALIPLERQPLLRWRMAEAQEGLGVWKGVARFLRERRPFIERVLGEIEQRGPLAASELGLGEKGEGGWWGWSEGKRALEGLFWTGALTTATRRNSFERVYGLPHQVLPRAIAEAPTPDPADARRALVAIAARAMGVATEPDLRDYFRMSPAHGRAAVAELVEAGELVPVSVKGWRHPAYRHCDARGPKKIEAAALLSPFDNLIWFRDRTERLFGVKVRLEIYTPEPKRTHGYYVLPFLEDEAITARVDLKADRQTGLLRVQAAHAEPWATPATAKRLAGELRRMAAWLGLEGVAVRDRGDLAQRLAEALA